MTDRVLVENRRFVGRTVDVGNSLYRWCEFINCEIAGCRYVLYQCRLESCIIYDEVQGVIEQCHAPTILPGDRNLEVLWNRLQIKGVM